MKILTLQSKLKNSDNEKCPLKIYLQLNHHEITMGKLFQMRETFTR